MQSEEVIKKIKEEIPKLKNVCGFHTINGITHVDIKLTNGGIKQIVLIFERNQVEEPEHFLTRTQIYADVFVEIADETLADIASKDLKIEEAIEKKLFRVFGDAEIWQHQLTVLKSLLKRTDLNFRNRAERFKTIDESVDTPTNYSKLPSMDLSNVPSEFKTIADKFASLREKYTFGNHSQS